MAHSCPRPRSFGQRRPGLLLFAVSLTLATLTSARPSSLRSIGHHDDNVDNDDNEMFFETHSRRSYCVNAAGKCFSSGQCCRGLVCAAIDDYFGQKPEVPGYCVKEKDLEVCATDDDCGQLGRCVALGRTGERYCLPRPSKAEGLGGVGLGRLAGLDAERAAAAAIVAGTLDNLKGAIGGLGSSCQYNADCKPSMDIGGDKLCCQDVRRGRQGVRRICDRVTPISTCIATPIN